MSLSPQKILVDSRGSYCPGPITDLFKAFRRANVGDEIELLATDPAAKSDVEAWARKSGNEVERVTEEGNVLRILVHVMRKGR